MSAQGAEILLKGRYPYIRKWRLTFPYIDIEKENVLIEKVSCLGATVGSSNLCVRKIKQSQIGIDAVKVVRGRGL